jgi:dTDP-4-dehydrorhamnose 3,5-epimerase
VKIRELSISGAFEITPVQRTDERGVFFEWYRFDQLEQELGHSLDLRQANASVSNKGVVRGIHFADFPRGQAKYITAMHGAVLDFVIDVRVGSPTFGQWDSVVLDTVERRAVYLAEGLGHAFIALTSGATVSYLVTDVYHPEKEHGINPLDSDIALVFPREAGTPVLSPKDLEAPSLAEARSLGILPAWATARDHYASLDSKKES